MHEPEHLNKEAIASRMYRQAARIWGLPDSQKDSFDPLVRMLIESCALELHRLDHELAGLERSMTERLAGMLCPEVCTQAVPAHAIIHAPSTDAHAYVGLDTQFLLKHKVASVPNGPLDAVEDFFFAPAGRFKIIDGSVRILAAGGHVYSVSPRQQKELLLKTHTALPPHTVLLGLDPGRCRDLQDVSLFFDLKDNPRKDSLLALLPYMHAACCGEKLQLQPGIAPGSLSGAEAGPEDALDALYINRSLTHAIGGIYQRHFMTWAGAQPWLKQNAGLSQQAVPEVLAARLDAAGLLRLPQQLIWIELKLPAAFTEPVLEDLQVSVNCFPVVNKRLHQMHYRLNHYFNIIPLPVADGQFFSVQSVSGTSPGAAGQTAYSYYPFDGHQAAGQGSYTVRTGGIQRFDSRDAAAHLDHLTELLRDESSAFAAFGQDYLTDALKTLNQTLSQIEQKIGQKRSQLPDQPAFLLIRPMEAGDTIFVRYWSTKGAAANGLRSGMQLDPYEGAAFRRDSLVLMTGSMGGADKLSQTGAIAAFKSALLSRDRLVTRADVMHFCEAWLRGRPAKLNVQPGVAVGALPGHGLMPVLEVRILLHADGTEDAEGLQLALLEALRSHSAPDMQYRVFVDYG